MLVSVITATIPGREAMLAECKASVEAQTHDAWEHIVLRDDRREGCSVMVNKMVAAAKGDYVFLLADDDLALPRCLELHLAAAGDGGIVYGPPLVWGIHDPWWFYQAPPAIPSTALMSRELFLDLGGYDETATREEDRGLWTRALDAGTTFARLDEPTWVYRIHGGNKSMVGTPYEAVAA